MENLKLNPGDSFEYPTWGGGTRTQLSLRNLSNDSKGKITYQVGGGRPVDVYLDPGEQVCIDLGDCHTIKVHVTNTGTTQVESGSCHQEVIQGSVE